MSFGLWDWLTAEQGYTPHGFCLIWDPSLVWVHVVSDTLIALAYFSIPAALFIAARRRPDFNPSGVLYLFSAFIIACGITHLFGIATMWHAIYGAEGVMKAATAAISLVVAMALWPLLPKLLTIPTHEDLRSAHAKLEDLNQELENKVEERTAELKKTSRQLQQALAEAECAARERTLFFATMNHELRTPLNAIVGFTDMLEVMWQKLPEERRLEYVKDIRASGLRLSTLVSEILEIERLRENPQQLQEGGTFAIADAARSAEMLLKTEIERTGARIEVNIPPHLELAGLRQHFERVITNCLSNAIKYCDTTPEISLTAREMPDRQIRLTIADNGIGMSQENLKNIFQPFRRFHELSHPEVPGTGLGVPLIRALTEQLGGSVSYRSRPGKGTAVILDFPVPAARIPAAAAS